MLRKSLFSCLCRTIALCTVALASPLQGYVNRHNDEPVDADYRHASPEAYENWRDLKFGLRIHFGLYSRWQVPQSWGLGQGYVSPDEYLDSYKQFNPVNFDADDWAEMMQACGFKFFLSLDLSAY